MNKTLSKYFYLLLSFLLGLIPSVLFIHIIAQDFTEYYTQAESFLAYKDYSFREAVGYGTNEINLNARAPLLPFLIATSKFLFGDTLFGAYLPILIARMLITPLAFLVSSFFLPVEIAFFASSMTIFSPKLQAFSLATFEADGFVVVFYLCALLFYLYYKNTSKKITLVICSLFLGLLSLVKEIGFPLSVGFITAVVIEQIINKSIENQQKLKNIINLSVPFLLVAVPFFLFTLLKGGNLYFSALTVDRNIKYLLENLPILIQTIPIYIGLEELNMQMLYQKSFFINLVILLCFLVGLFYLFVKKNFILIFPTVFTILSLGLLNEIALGGKVAGNSQLISILAFVVPVTSIMIFKGFLLISNYFLHRVHRFSNLQNLIYFSLSLLLVFKFVNNFFSKPYVLNDQRDRYVNLLTVISDKKQIPPPLFEKNAEGTLMVSDLDAFDSFMNNVYRNNTIEVFSPKLKLLLLTVLLTGIIYFYGNYLIKRREIKN